MTTKHKKWIISFVLLVTALNTMAQVGCNLISSKNKRHPKKCYPIDRRSAVGLAIGGGSYYGDISPGSHLISTDISSIRPAFGIFYTQRLGCRYTLKTELTFVTIEADDRVLANKNDTKSGIYRYERGMSFRNQIKELSVTVVLDFRKSQKLYANRRKWIPYVFAGISAFLHNPQAKAPDKDLLGNPLPEAGTWVDLRPLGTEGQNAKLDPTDVNFGIRPYSYFQLAFPVGMGIRFKLSEAFDIWFDTGFRFTFTDYLDDVSRNYVDLGVLDSELARALSYKSSSTTNPANLVTYTARNGETYTVINHRGAEGEGNVRGNKDNFDAYMITTIRVTYAFNKLLSARYRKF